MTLSPNAVAFRELLAPKSKSADAWDEAVELLSCSPPATGGGDEEGEAKADITDETGAADHDMPPGVISRTV